MGALDASVGEDKDGGWWWVGVFAASGWTLNVKITTIEVRKELDIFPPNWSSNKGSKMDVKQGTGTNGEP